MMYLSIDLAETMPSVSEYEVAKALEGKGIYKYARH